MANHCSNCCIQCQSCHECGTSYARTSRGLAWCSSCRQPSCIDQMVGSLCLHCYRGNNCPSVSPFDRIFGHRCGVCGRTQEDCLRQRGLRLCSCGKPTSAYSHETKVSGQSASSGNGNGAPGTGYSSR